MWRRVAILSTPCEFDVLVRDHGVVHLVCFKERMEPRHDQRVHLRLEPQKRWRRAAMVAWKFGSWLEAVPHRQRSIGSLFNPHTRANNTPVCCVELFRAVKQTLYASIQCCEQPLNSAAERSSGVTIEVDMKTTLTTLVSLCATLWSIVGCVAGECLFERPNVAC